MPTLEAVDGTFPQTAPETVTTSRQIDAPIAEVWKAIDGLQWASWFPGMSEFESTSHPRTGMGASRRVKINVMEFEETFVTYEPMKSWGFTITKSNLPLAKKIYEGVELESIDDGARTKLTYVGAYEPNLLSKVFRKPIQKGFTDSWGAAFDGLADYLTW